MTMDGEEESNRERNELNGIAFQLLTEFTFNAIQSLVDTSSSLRALELNRPYWSHAGKAAGLFLKRELKLENQDLATLSFSEKVVHSSFGIESVWLSDEKGYVVTNCPFKDGPPEFCILLDSVVANGFIESVSPIYEFVMQEMMSQGAPHCESVLRLKGSRHAIPPRREVPEVNIPKDQLDDLAIQYLGEHWVMATRAALDYEDSPETISLLKMRMRQQGISKGLLFKEILGVQGNDAVAISSILDFFNSLLRQEGRTISSAGELVEKEIVQCPFRDAPGAICDQLEAFTNGICEAVNPEFELVHTRAMCKGDSKCARAIKRKGIDLPAKGDEYGDEEAQIDPTKVLMLRLAKGEINEHEYKRLKRLLEE